MKSLLILFLLGSCSANIPERECGRDLSNLWLDVVAVVDDSKGVTQGGLYNIIGTLNSVLQLSKIGTRKDNPRTTRLGLVSYNYNETIEATLNDYQFLDTNKMMDQLKISSNIGSYLVTGLSGAEQLFKQDKEHSREHYRKVVIVFASTYKDDGANDPKPVAARFLSSGGIIITVAYSQSHDTQLLEKLGGIATKEFNFTNDDPGLIEKIQDSLLKANCFCPNSWHQYQPKGTCIQPVTLPASWSIAQASCHHKGNNGHLVNEYSREKHDFVMAILKTYKEFQPTYKYHIGLNGNCSLWKWDQASGEEQVQLQGWQIWAPDFPRCSPMLEMLEGVTYVTDGWINVPSNFYANYVCETSTCDTDNYCARANDFLLNRV